MSSTNSGSIDGKVRTWVISSCHVVDWTYITDIALQFATALIDTVTYFRAHGMTAFEYHGTDPQFNKVFNNGMVHHSTITMKKILEMYKGFEGLKTVVDVGGGTGAVFNMIISKYPHTKGINFDLPHVLSDAPNYPGVEQVGGDMFVSVPSGDAIFMKSDGNGRWEFLFPYLRLQGFKVEGRWQPLSDKQCWCPLPHIQYHQYHLLHQVVCRANFCGLVVRSSSYMHMEQHLYVVLFAMQ